MRFTSFALPAAAFALAAPLAAETHVQPAVRPGGDIPPAFHPAVPPIPRGGDVPRAFRPPRADFQYVRREVMIPMRDGAKLYTVLIIPKGTDGRKANFPIMLDRTPYSADKSTTRGGFGRGPRTFSRLCTPSWSAPATSSPSRTSAASTSPKAIM